MIMKRDAFTMLELVFAIVIAGVLAALAIPRLERDFRQEAIDNVLSSIRYTQHLALMDNRHSRANVNWQRSFWTIRFQQNGNFFTISSNANLGNNVDENETARDPVTGKRFYSDDDVVDDNESINIFLNRKYGIDDVDFTNCTNISNGATNDSRHIAFDHMGRPHKGMYGVASNVYDTRMTADCNITFSFSDANIAPFTVQIQEETGYAQIVGQEAL